MNPISKRIWSQCAVHNAKHTRIFLHRGIFFSFSLVLSLLHTTTTGYVQRQDKVSHWLPQWEIFEVKYWCFFYQILMKRNERTLYRIELLYMMQNNFSQVGQYVCIKILELSISSETMMLWSGFVILLKKKGSKCFSVNWSVILYFVNRRSSGTSSPKKLI